MAPAERPTLSPSAVWSMAQRSPVRVNALIDDAQGNIPYDLAAELRHIFAGEGARLGMLGPFPRDGLPARRSSVRNMAGSASDAELSAVIDKYLAEEVSAGRVIAVWPEQLSAAEWPHLHVSPLGVIIKGGGAGEPPGKPRLIFDLSDDSAGPSVNECIPPGFTAITFPTARDVARWLLSRAAEAQASGGLPLHAASFDIKAAFRNVPLAASELHVNTMSWKSRVYVDCRLGFGAACGPSLFCKLGAAISIALAAQGCPTQRMADDFMVAVPGKDECELALMRALLLLKKWGVAVSEAKTTHACAIITHLGFLWDLPAQSTSIPAAKWGAVATLMAELRATLASDARAPFTTSWLRTLRSLTGKLQWATTVLPHGKALLQGMFGAVGGLDGSGRREMGPGRQLRGIDGARRLRELKTELAWWADVLSLAPPTRHWLSVARPKHDPLLPSSLAADEISVFCDASQVGLGAVWPAGADVSQCQWAFHPVPPLERFDNQTTPADDPRTRAARVQSSLHLELRALLLALLCCTLGPALAPRPRCPPH